MISGRGLGHTGGTLDKLDAVPGYVTQPGVSLFRKVVREAGCAIIGQTADLAPADKRLYAIRDVTATVETIPLLVSSILSKKLAAGLHGLAMDVKFGSGAFLPDYAKAQALAQALVAVANDSGLPTHALLTDMDEPLASVAGNALEVAYALDHLTGRRREERFHEVTVALGAEMLLLGRLAADLDAARTKIENAFASGAAAERFARMVAALGGPADLLEKPANHLAAAPIVKPVFAETAGAVAAIDTRGVGLAIVALGGGRVRPQDPIDHAVGIVELAGIGEEVGPERPLGIIHARDEAGFAAASARLRKAYRIGEAAARGRLVAERMTERAST
jgi:thymidine phosphorylase